MASTYLNKTFSGSGSLTTWTFSAWIKKCDDAATGTIFAAYTDGSNHDRIIINSNGTLSWYAYTSGSYVGNKNTNRVFRDTNAWYNIVCQWNTTSGTASERMRIWINGVEETSFATDTNPGSSASSNFNNHNRQHVIGSAVGSLSGTAEYFNGVMSHVHFCDGTALAPTVFGSTDSTTGEWKINTAPSFTPGTNGFTILKDGMTITDQSANSNNFTLGGGTLTKTEDCPSNVFSTIDLLSTHASDYTFANGNNKVTNSNGSTRITRGTLGASSGKYYFETKIATVGGSGGFGTGLYVGVTDADYFEQLGTSQAFIGTGPNQVAQRGDGSHLAKNNTQINGYESCSAGSILQVALDLDNGYVYFGVNGTWGNSGDPTSGATGTGGVSITTGKTYMFAASGYNGWSVETNFGNGYFGTTAITSEGTNASGIGKFEYDVPANYTSLSTKGLNE
jgi:hypothetical protein